MSRTSRKQQIKEYKRKTNAGQPQSPFIEVDRELDEWAKLSPSQKLEMIGNIAAHAGRDFEEFIYKFENDCTRIDPLYTLAVNVFYKRSSLAPDEWSDKNAFLQADSEVLHAMLLRRKYKEYSQPRNYFEAAVIADGLGESIRRSSREYLSLKDAELLSALPPEKLTAKSVSEQMRSQTQFVRNWGTIPQMLECVKKAFAPLENEVQKETGLRVADLLDMYMRIAERTETRFTKFCVRSKGIMMSRTPRQAVRRFCEFLPEFKGSERRLLDEINAGGLGPAVVKEWFQAEATKILPDVFMFSLEDFAAAYPQDMKPEILKPVLDRWSLTFGDLSELDIKSFFLENPVKLKPLISRGDDRYFFSGMEIFGSFCFQIIESWINSIPPLEKKYTDKKYKGAFLENKVVEEFKKYFPAQSIIQKVEGMKKVHGFNFESDVVILDDELMMLVEAKSNRIDQDGLTGKILRLKKKIEELIVKPSAQSERFENYVINNPGIIRTKIGSKRDQKIDTSQVRLIVRFSVSLDSLGELSTNTRRLKEANLIEKETKVVPTITLADLETILDLLPGVCQKAHYFLRRFDLAEAEYFLADEMDLLFTYLRTGFNFKNVLPEDIAGEELTMIELRRNSRHLTPYTNAARANSNINKPERRLTKWWKRIIERLEIERTSNWLKMGCFLLDMSIDEQVYISKIKSALVKNVENERSQPGVYDTFSFEIGHDAWRGTLCLLVYKNVRSEDLMLITRCLWLQEQRSSPTKRVLVIAYNAGDKSKTFTQLRYSEN